METPESYYGDSFGFVCLGVRDTAEHRAGQYREGPGPGVMGLKLVVIMCLGLSPLEVFSV